jgi:hypothetical protein
MTTILSREQIDAILLAPYPKSDESTISVREAEWYGLADTSRAYHDAVEIIEWLVQQHCYQEEDGSYDTAALSTNRDAFDFLVQAGRAEYVGEQYGRRAFIRFLED